MSMACQTPGYRLTTLELEAEVKPPCNNKSDRLPYKQTSGGYILP